MFGGLKILMIRHFHRIIYGHQDEVIQILAIGVAEKQEIANLEFRVYLTGKVERCELRLDYLGTFIDAFNISYMSIYIDQFLQYGLCGLLTTPVPLVSSV